MSITTHRIREMAALAADANRDLATSYHESESAREELIDITNYRGDPGWERLTERIRIMLGQRADLWELAEELARVLGIPMQSVDRWSKEFDEDGPGLNESIRDMQNALDEMRAAKDMLRASKPAKTAKRLFPIKRSHHKKGSKK